MLDSYGLEALPPRRSVVEGGVADWASGGGVPVVAVAGFYGLVGGCSLWQASSPQVQIPTIP